MPLSLPIVRPRAGLLRWCRLGLGLVVALIAVACALLLVAGLVLHWGILPHLDYWRPRIEAMVGRSLGTEVRIGRIAVDSSAWVPSFDLGDVVLVDAEHRESLRLPRVRAALATTSLATFEPRFAQLLIESPRLEIRRDRDGRIRVAGLDVDGGTVPDSQAAADWLFSQHEIVIQGGVLRWIDELRAAPPLHLTNVTLVLRNGLISHDLRLDATPPPAWGERFSLRARLHQPLIARAGDWRRWSGSLQADLPDADVGQLRRHVDLPFEADRGSGALRAWLTLDSARFSEITIDLALRDVAVRLGRGLQAIALARVEGRLEVIRQADGLRLKASGFGFATADGGVWPAGAIELSLHQRVEPQADRSRQSGASAVESGKPFFFALPLQEISAGEFSADRLDLDLLAHLATRMPLGAGLRRLLAELTPRGTANAVSARWLGALDAPTTFRVTTRLRGLAIAAAPKANGVGIGRPGWRNADLDLDAREDGGSARLTLADGSLIFPGVFDQPEVALRHFEADLAWKLVPAQAGAAAGFEVGVSAAKFDNDDASGELNANWHSGRGNGFGKGARLPGVFELSGELSRGLGGSVARYLPRGIPEATRDYVQRAVRGGELTRTSFSVKGDLADFPFVNPRDGEFRIATHVRNLGLSYVPGPSGYGRETGVESPWPAFSAVEGDLIFDRTSMAIQNARANLWGIELRGVQGTIRNLTDQATLEIEGQGHGPLADMLRFVNTSPVGAMIGNPLAQASASGVADLRLALSLPLHRIVQTTVRGAVVLSGNDFRLRADLPLLAETRARVEFTHKGVSIAGGNTHVMGGELSFDGASQADGSLRLNGQGMASADGLRRTAELGAMARIARSLQGQAPYRLQLNAHNNGAAEAVLTSTLAGMAIALPPPLDKAADANWPMRWQFARASADAPTRERTRFDLGGLLRARFDLDGAVLRGSLAVGDVSAGFPLASDGGSAAVDAQNAAAGVSARIALHSVDLDAWRNAASRLMADAGIGADSTIFPSRIALRSDEVIIGSRKLDAVKFDLERHGPLWHLAINADQLAGKVDYQESGVGGGSLKARLTHLSLPRAEAESVESLLDQAPASMPALDIIVEDLDLRGHKLGRFEVDAVNQAGADWRLRRLDLRNADAHLVADGHWAFSAGSPRRRMGLQFKLELNDGSALLERLGYSRMMQGGKGSASGEIGWLGSPWQPDLASLDGRVELALATGQFLQVDTGAARLFSLLSLQSLPRRLTLDFRDVFLEGFAFDQISGNIRFDHGIAATNNLRVRSVQAAVLLEGEADLFRQTQDLNVIVVPEINAGTASLAYAAIHPAVGLGTFFAQWLLRRPLQEAGTRQYHVSGAWDEPKIDRVERKPGSLVPEFDPLPAPTLPPPGPNAPVVERDPAPGREAAAHAPNDPPQLPNQP
jgi:uncharacterized protein (TIGR02099 family)